MFLFTFFIAIIISLSASVYAQTVVALGDSVTQGYGVAKSSAYPALIEQKLKKRHPKIKVINAGISGATTASAISNLKWQLKRPFDVLVICLGGNDGLRGLNLKQSEKNLSEAIDLAKKNKVKVLLVGMKIPENYGLKYRKQFEGIYKKLAKKHKVPLMPFLLKDVGAVKSLNLPDGIHPNEKGYEKIAVNLLPYIEKLL